MPSSEADRVGTFLKKNLAAFSAGLDTKNMLSELLSADVITYDELDALTSMRRSGASNRGMTEELWTILRMKTTEEKLAFLRCVQAKQPHLVRDIGDLLGGTPGK